MLSDSVMVLTIYVLASAFQSQWGYFCLSFSQLNITPPDFFLSVFLYRFLFSSVSELSLRRGVAIRQVPGSLWARGSCQLRGRGAVELLQRTLGEEGGLGTPADGHCRAAHQQRL